MHLNNSDALTAYQFILTFDPSVINIVNPNESFRGTLPAFAPLGSDTQCETARRASPCPDSAWLLTASGRTPYAGPETIDNAMGTVLVVYGSQGASSPSTGDGAIAILEIVGQQVGSTTVTISESILADSQIPPAAIPHATGTLDVLVDANGRSLRPNLSPIGRRVITAGEVTLIDISAFDPNGDAVILSLQTSPIFASIVDNGDGTGQLRLAPTRFDVGTFTITIVASDGSLVVSETIKLRVVRPGGP